MLKQPIGFFVHSQGRGHVKRCEAIIQHFDPDQPVSVFTSDRSMFTLSLPNITFIDLASFVGNPDIPAGLYNQMTPEALHCVPLGRPEITRNIAIITSWMAEHNPALFFIDVSAELAILSRISSVPCVKVRMHGNRNDTGHIAAYQSCVGLLAPFNEKMEQDDYPAYLKDKTYYTGGLCTTTVPVLSRQQAREKLGLDQNKQIILVLSGGGGSGTPFAPLTMGARAVPDADWLVVGKVHREGHETNFANLKECGWVNNTIDYIAAADIVIASSGDNTVHEIARVGRPYLCVPEWRYFDEQVVKAQMLHKLGAARYLPHWPGNNPDWQQAIQHAVDTTDIDAQRTLYNEDAAINAARYLQSLVQNLWHANESTAPNVHQLNTAPSVSKDASISA